MMNRHPAYAAPELHLISAEGIESHELLSAAAAVLPYVDYIHLRDKQLSAKKQFELVKLLRQAGVPLEKIVINDRLDVALAAGAANIQLAGHSLPAASVRSLAQGMRIGCSVHSAEAAAQAASEGADYCLFGHVYDSSSKPGLPGRGLNMLAEVCARCPVPVIAIGGIRPDNAGDVIRNGAQGIAVLSGLHSAADPAAEAKSYRDAIHAAWP
ncbi:thiamine phosphate synthase [Paenibacillus macerans]|uniref:thiamine phosphate synthase n=1 Tax=Paenibacillus macerans TaxID=44252 RepID=UPI002E1DC394|nr:thiamine phosphate synthase [Paenibacillus macerans]